MPREGKPLDPVRAQLLAELKPIVDCAYANPLCDNVGLPVITGDQMTPTVPHRLMASILRLEPFWSGIEWQQMKTWIRDAQGTISREYPGVWLKRIAETLEKGE